MKIKEKYVILLIILIPFILLLWLFSRMSAYTWWESTYQIVAIVVGPAVTALCFHYKLFE